MTQAPEFRLVPVEPTEAMHAAAVKTIVHCNGNDDFPPRVWRAMLAAAPLPATPAADRRTLRESTGTNFRGMEYVTREWVPDAPAADRAVSELPKGWMIDQARESEPGIVELGSLDGDGAFCGFVTIDTDDYFQPEKAMPIARAIIDALARSTDAPSKRQAWWRQKCPKCGASRTDSPGCQCEDDPGALLRQIRALGDEMKRVGPGVLVPVPELVAEEGRKFMRGLPSLFDRLPIGDVVAATSMLETVALATPPAAATSTPCASGEAAVGEIVRFGDYKEVSWRDGKLPAIGTKLYAASQAPAAGVVPAFAIGGMHASTICGTAATATDARAEDDEPDTSWVRPITERAADMLTAYAEQTKALGRYAEEHYIPEVEHVIEELRALTQADSTGGKS
jgi:hypothetical protein